MIADHNATDHFKDNPSRLELLTDYECLLQVCLHLGLDDSRNPSIHHEAFAVRGQIMKSITIGCGGGHEGLSIIFYFNSDGRVLEHYIIDRHLDDPLFPK